MGARGGPGAKTKSKRVFEEGRQGGVVRGHGQGPRGGSPSTVARPIQSRPAAGSRRACFETGRRNIRRSSSQGKIFPSVERGASGSTGRTAVTGEALYLDSSAIVKLILPEPETRALVARLDHDPEVLSSALARAEVLRAMKRIRATPATRSQAERVLGRIALVRIDDAVLDRAAAIDPAELGSLDSIHLATALGIGERLDGMITYDSRLGDAADRAGLPVLIPA